MANLLYKNIGTNYKGILNLDATTINTPLDATLRAVTDGMGTSSPLQLSTTQVMAGNILFQGSTIYRNVDTGAGLYLYGGTTTTTGNAGSILIQHASTFWGAPIFSLANVANAANRFTWRTDSVSLMTLDSLGNLAVGSGAFTPSARLHVRGDGTNPVARFENSSGDILFGVAADLNVQMGNGNSTFGTTNDSSAYNSSGNAFLFRTNVTVSPGLHMFTIAQINTISATSGISGGLYINNGTFGAAAGSANFRPLNITYTLNNSGAQTGTATGIFLNATETALNGMTHNLMDLQVGGVSAFKVSRTGAVAGGSYTTTGALFSYGVNEFYGSLIVSGNIRTNAFMQFSGTTNAFPMIKRNGAAIDFRLADDSGYCTTSMGTIVSYSGSNYVQITNTEIVNAGTDFAISTSDSSRSLIFKTNTGSGRVEAGRFDSTGSFVVGKGSASVASALVEFTSTTRGFLMPRQTTAQINAIATPAAGLQVYNTDLGQPCFYDGTGWRKVSHSAM